MQPTPVLLPGEFQEPSGLLLFVGSQRVRHDWAHTDRHIHTFFHILFSILVCQHPFWILNIVPCAMQWDLVCVHSRQNRLYLLTPSSQAIPLPATSPLASTSWSLCLAEWPSLKSPQTSHVEKRECSYTVGGNVSFDSHCGKQSREENCHTRSCNLLLGVYPEKSQIYNDTGAHFDLF